MKKQLTPFFKKSFLIVTTFSFLMLALVFPAHASSKDFSEFETLPILHEGRIKPLDSYAKTILLQFSGKRSFNRKPAIEWLAKLLFSPEEARGDDVFQLRHPGSLDALGLEKKERSRYSYSQLEGHIEKIFELHHAALQMEAKDRSAFDAEMIRLGSNVALFMELGRTFQFAAAHSDFFIHSSDLRDQLGFSISKEDYSYIDVALKANKMIELVQGESFSTGEEASSEDRALLELMQSLYYWARAFEKLSFTNVPSYIEADEAWISPWDALQQISDASAKYEVMLLKDMMIAYRTGRLIDLNHASKKMKDSLGSRANKKVARAYKYLDLETFLNKAKPFFWSKLFFFFATLLLLLFFTTQKYLFYKIGVIFTIIATVPLTLGILTRILILARPPVSGLYETFIFVGWVSAVIGLVIEKLNRKGVGAICAAILGFILLIVANRYSQEGDTLQMLVAVLNSNFWLTIHVPTITMGYAACCVAAVLGHLYLIQAIVIPKEALTLNSTYRYMLGIVGLGLLLTFFGTSLGGIWADQSWGRFWGWDPKENGALMIVLWCAILVHLKIGKIVGPIGYSAGCVFLGLVVVWAWFGVNLLSVGLHSYGFTSGVAGTLLVYAVLELFFLLIAVPLAAKRQVAKIKSS